MYIVLIRNIYGFFRNVEQVFHFENDFEDEILTKFVLSILKKHTFLLFVFYLAIDFSRIKFELICILQVKTSQPD